MRLAPVGMGGHVWMKRMDFTASVLRALSPHTVTLRWMNVAAAHVSMAHAGMTSMGKLTAFVTVPSGYVITRRNLSMTILQTCC